MIDEIEMAAREAYYGKGRLAIIEAKRNLYHLILSRGHGDLTEDDLRMGEALVKDSEIQAILQKAK